MRNFRDWELWKESRKLVKLLYEFSKDFPNEEKFGLTSQLRRAGISIPTNIAEGASRKSEKEFAHFLSLSLGSAFEVETLLHLSVDLGYLEKKRVDEIILELNTIQRQLQGFINSIQK